MVEILKYQAEVMLAYGDKLIQIRERGTESWQDDSGIRPLCFNWCGFEYRIKPEPRDMYVRPMDLHTHAPNGECEQTGCIKVREVEEKADG